MDGTDSKQAKQPSGDDFSDKVWREFQLAGVGLTAIPDAAAKAVTEHPVETSLKLAAATGLSLALGYATSKAGPFRGLAQSVGVGLGVTMIGDFSRNLSPAVHAFSDNWDSGVNWDRNAATVRDRLAPFVFDTMLTTGGALAGGYGGARWGRANTFEPTLPKLTDKGFLPPGIHKATWNEFATTFGTTGRRADLLANMEFLLQEAKATGAADKVYVGGSFVSAKPTPKDFDMTWKIDGPTVGKLRETAPITVDRTLQSKTLGGELMVTYPNAPDGSVLAFLQRNLRHRVQVGVVEIDLASIPSKTSYRVRNWLGRAGVRPIEEIAKTEPLEPMPKNSPHVQ